MLSAGGKSCAAAPHPCVRWTQPPTQCFRADIMIDEKAHQLSPSEWQEALDYLLDRLREQDLSSVAEDLSAVARTRIAEEQSDYDLFGVSPRARKELGTTVIRPRTSFESFAAAFDLLQARLVEVPAMAATLQVEFDVRPENIIFVPDQNATASETLSAEEFSVATISLNADELEEARSMLDKLGLFTGASED